MTSTSHEKGNLSGCSVEVPHCSQSTIIDVNISAANKLGEGPHSNPFTIGKVMHSNNNIIIINFVAECTNNFVQIVYEETTTESTISCEFLNQSDTSEKSCCITYGLCDQNLPQISLECNEHKFRSVTDSVSSGQLYCYTAIASNNTHIVIVEGNFIAGNFL